MKRSNARHALLAVFASLTLAACGGGGGSDGAPPAPPPTSPPAAAETLFVTANAWTGAQPADAEVLSTDEFRRRQAAGDLVVTTPSAQQAKATANRSQVEAERQFLANKTDLSPDVLALLAQAAAANNLDAQAVATLPDGTQVALNPLSARIEAAAASYRLARDPANALAAYALSHSLLSDALKAQLPTPASLSSATLAQIQTATGQLNDALATLPNIDQTRLDPDSVATRSAAKRALTAGNGVDTGGACAATGYARQFWFPLRYFVSPVKSQGERGTCWAFAAVGAVESRERVQNNNPANVSEQFLVNKVKREWFENDFNDGGSAASALNTAVDRNQTLMPETGWTYNPAAGRPDNAFASGVAGTAASYAGACNGYNGWCSPTAHQSQPFCTTVSGVQYCGFNTHRFTGAGVPASRVRQLWANGGSFNLHDIRGLLASGVSLIATFPIYEGFWAAPPTGIVSDYRKQMRNAAGMLVDGDYGSHLVQIVGFISNEALTWPGAAPATVGGGGYFIVRNSWGCQGDGGYYYVPADYVSSLFSNLEVLEFDARRSAAWNADQVTPGGSAGLAINPQGTKLVDLRVQDNLASSFVVSHPVANYVRLTVTSNRDGLLYDGQWLVNPSQGAALFGNVLPFTFNTEGTSVLTLTARYGNQMASVTKQILVFNSPPSVQLVSNGAPAQGENFVVDAIPTDRNETDPSAMCNAMTWAVTAPDTVVSGSGCNRTLRFGASGNRDVRVTTQDREGRQASAIQTYAVTPPPVNPYPRIASFAALSRDALRIDNNVVGCTNNAVPNNARIDLRQLGCRRFSVGGTDGPRYFSQVGIENPSAEALSYDWTYTAYPLNPAVAPRTVTARTATPQFDMAPFIFGARDTPYACTVDVRVNAPQASRSKTQRVWSGQCIHVEDAPR